MIIGFIIWSIVAIVFLGVGISSRKANEAVGFFPFGKPAKIEDVQHYNNDVSFLWIVAAGMLELIGIAFLLLEQTAPLLILIFFALRILILAMLYMYFKIETKHATR